MKAVVKLPHCDIEVQAESVKDLFGKMAQVSEVFGDDACGLCGDTNIKPIVREVAQGKQVFTYYEIQCNKCFARLSMGQSLDTKNLFPKRKLLPNGAHPNPKKEDEVAAAKFGKHKGWTTYRGEKSDD